MTYDSRLGGLLLFGGLRVDSGTSWALLEDTWLFRNSQ